MGLKWGLYIEDSILELVNSNLEFSSANKPTLKFVVAKEIGTFNLTVTTKNGSEYLLSKHRI